MLMCLLLKNLQSFFSLEEELEDEQEGLREEANLEVTTDSDWIIAIIEETRVLILRLSIERSKELNKLNKVLEIFSEML